MSLSQLHRRVPVTAVWPSGDSGALAALRGAVPSSPERRWGSVPKGMLFPQPQGTSWSLSPGDAVAPSLRLHRQWDGQWDSGMDSGTMGWLRGQWGSQQDSGTVEGLRRQRDGQWDNGMALGDSGMAEGTGDG